MDMLKSLFIPADGFLDDKVQDLKEKLAKRMGVETYTQLFSALKGYVSKQLDFGGFIDISMWMEHLPTIKNYIRGFFYPLIILGDVRFLIWMIRGSSPYGATQETGGGRT